MKATEFKKLIREEVRRALKENTQLMNNPGVKAKVEMVIKTLQSIDIDGETMQYVLEKVGMGEQMQHQLTPGGIREVEQSIAPYYYFQFNGVMQPMGPTAEDPTGRDRSDRVSRGPLNKPADILNVRRFPKNSWKEMTIYKTMINSKPGYVLISADDRNKWAIIQTDAKFNASITAAATVDDEQERRDRYHYAYRMAFDAVTGYKYGEKKDPKITPEEFLKS